MAAAAAKTSRPAKAVTPADKKTSPSPAKRATPTVARAAAKSAETAKTSGTAPTPFKRATAKAAGTPANTTGMATNTAPAGKTAAVPGKTARPPAKTNGAATKSAPAGKTASTPAKTARPAARTTGTPVKASGIPATPAKRAAVKASPSPRPPRPATPRPAATQPEPETETAPATARIFTPARPVADESRPKASSVIAGLWLEREEQIRAATPEPVVEAHRPRPDTPGFMSGKGGLVAALVAVAVLLGGAVGVFLAQGGGAPSKATFIANADAVCGATDTSIAAVAKPTSYPELATAVGTVVTAADAQVAGLAKVRLPTGIAGTAAADAIGSLTTTSQAAHSLADAAGKKDDAATATATSHLMTQYADAAAKAKAFGFSACATGMQPGMDNVTGGAKGLVKATFLAKADSLCREASRKLDAIPPFKANGADVARYFGQGVAITIKTATDLRSLAAPPGDEATVADMLAAEDKVNAKLGELRDAAAAGDQSRFIAAGNELDVLGTASDAKFDAYGLSVCGSNFGES